MIFTGSAERSETSPPMARAVSAKYLAASGVALQGSPLLGLGDGMLDADPPGRLLFAGRFPFGGLTGCGVLPRFLGRGGDLAGEVPGQALVSGVDVGGDIWVGPEQASMPSVRSAVASSHAARADRPGHSEPPRPSPITVGLFVFCFFLPDTNARRPGRPAGQADLHLGAVDAQVTPRAAA